MKKITPVLLFVFLLCVGNCMAKGYWPGDYTPKPDPPPEVTPPPVTPPPVQITVTEHGQRQSYSTETNWHFSKPIKDYGKFDLYVGGKKYVVSMAYKDSQVEARNSQTTGKLVVIAPASFKDRAARISYPSTGQPTPPPVTPPPADTGYTDVDYRDIVHHWNPMSFAEGAYKATGRCMTVLFCVRDKYKSVTFTDAQNGSVTEFHLHNGNDEGREAWSSVDWTKKMPTHRTGTVVAVAKDGTKYRFKIPAGGKTYMDYKGYCFGKR